MTGSQKILLSGGLALAILGMAYGLWYAARTSTLPGAHGRLLASAFAEVAKGEMDPAREFLKTYGDTRFEYIREVHTMATWWRSAPCSWYWGCFSISWPLPNGSGFIWRRFWSSVPLPCRWGPYWKSCSLVRFQRPWRCSGQFLIAWLQ